MSKIIAKCWAKVFGKDRGERIFVLTAVILPLMQFFLFYVCVNFNQIIMSFQKYEGTSDVAEWAWLDNYIRFLKNMVNDPAMEYCLKNSFIFFGTSVISLLVGMIIAYMWWKEPPFHDFFKFIALLPSLISITVFIMLYRFTITDMLPELFDNPKLGELLLEPQSLWTVLIVGVLLGAGPQWVMLLGAINNIPKPLVEYSKMEGVNPWDEIRYLVFPFIYPTLVSYFIVSLAGLFSNYGQLVSFYNVGADPSIRTIGYHFFAIVFNSTTLQQYPYAAASGCFFSVITFVLVMTGRKILEKIGPSEE